MRQIALTILLGICFVLHAEAQEESDSEFTTTILSYKNAIKYRPAPGRYLRSEEGIQELGITSEQIALIDETINRGKSEIDRLVKAMGVSISAEESKELGRQHKTALRKHRADIIAILTPSQRRRFAQVGFQKHISSSNTLSMYLHPLVQSFIELTDSQQRKLNRVIGDANKEYLETLAALNEKYRQRVLDGIDESVRDKVDDVVGEPWFRVKSYGQSVLTNDVGNKK